MPVARGPGQVYSMGASVDEDAARKERVLAYMQQQAAEDSYEWESDDSEYRLGSRAVCAASGVFDVPCIEALCDSPRMERKSARMMKIETKR